MKILLGTAALLLTIFFQCWSSGTTATATPTHTATSSPIATPTPNPIARPSGVEALVVAIIDGDTIEVAIEGHNSRLRYIGINTPERDEIGGSEATQVNAQLVDGQIVRLEKDVSEIDKYGRLLRYVYVGNLFVNAELVRLGYAQAATYPPDVTYADLFVQLEREAREAQQGLWAQTVSPEIPSIAQWSCDGNLYNCGDFSSCESVMSYWEACPGDPSKLDQDHDGKPCESLCD